MTDIPSEAETKAVVEEEVVPEAPPTDPVSEFKKGKAKREAKRKEVKVIAEYVPEPPAPVEAPPAVDVESIVDRVAQAVFEKMAVERVTTPEPKKAKAKPAAKKKEKSPSPPPTKYFGWC